MHVRYWNRRSPQLNRLRALLPNPSSGTIDRSVIDDSLTLQQRQQVIDYVEHTFIPGLQSVLGSAGKCDHGTDLVRLETGAIVLGRVRASRVFRFAAAAATWCTATKPTSVTIWPSLHYTDWLLARVVQTSGLRIGLLSRMAANIARWVTFATDRRIYAPRVFRAAAEVPHNLPELMFVATMETHAKNLIPLMRAAQVRGIRTGLVTASGAKHWKNIENIRSGTRVMNFRDFITAEDLAQYEMDQKKYHALFSEHAPLLQKLCMFNGVALWPLLRSGLRDLYVHTLPGNLLYIRIADRMIARGVQAVVNSRILRASEAALAARARVKGIRVTTVVHGLISDEPDLYYASGRFDLSDRVYVWNEVQRAHVQRKRTGIHGDVVVDGNPQWEAIAHLTARREDLLDVLGISASARSYKKMITFCVQPSNTKQIWQDVAEAARRSPGTLLIMKTHPTVPISSLQEVIGDSIENIRIVDDRVDLYQLVAASDVMITVSSTVLFEALIIGTPVVLYDVQQSSFVGELRSFGAPAVTDRAALLSIFTENKSRAEYLQQCMEFRSRYLGETIDYQGISDRMLSFAYDTSKN